MSLSSPLLVMTTLPDAEQAGALARHLVEAHLAACVNVFPSCRSIYRWQGELHEDGEVLLLIKTVAEHYGSVEAIVRERHPYELPELVALNIDGGLPDYLAWLADATRR